MGERTRSRIGTNEGVRTVRVFSANPKTADGFNTFIFRRDVARSLSKLAWAPVIDARQNRMPVDIAVSDERAQYSREQKKTLILFLTEQLRKQYGPVENDDFGCFVLQRLFAKEVQRHALATRREYVSTLSARSVASGMVHFAAAPNEEIVRRNGIRYFEYGLAKVRMDDGLYLIMGEVGVRSGSSPYYDQHVVAKFKADSEVSSLQGHIRIGEPAFEQVYDNRFRLILQGVGMYYNTRSSIQTIPNQTFRQSPKFSIIIPVYNVASYLRECLSSVVKATEQVEKRGGQWKDSPLVEVICVDDGSTDGSGEILDEYAKKTSKDSAVHLHLFSPPRFRVIHQQNQGLSAARNVALDQATGEWLLYLDSDDVLSPWALETYVKMMERYPQADILRAGMVTSADGKWNWGAADGECTGLDVRGRVTMYGLDGYFVRMAYRRSVYGDIRFVGLGWCEERPYVAKCLARMQFVTDIPVAVYGFRVREGSITHRKMTLAEWKGFLWATMEIAKTFQESGRAVDSRVARLLTLVWMEKQVFFLCTHLRPEEKRAAWRIWFDSIGGLGCGLPVAPWFRFTRALCRLTKSRAVAWCLCCLPHWLKARGLHRRHVV